MKRIFALAAVAALGLVGTAGVSAAPPAATAAVSPATATTTHTASAATYIPAAQPAPPSCPPQYVCGYTGPNYTGQEGVLIEDNPDLTLYPIPWEHVDSIYNNGVQCEVWMYRWKNYLKDGHVVGFKMQTGFKNLQTQAPGLYHHTWSNHWCTNT
jgi:Peptidase inhibitor family I36